MLVDQPAGAILSNDELGERQERTALKIAQRVGKELPAALSSFAALLPAAGPGAAHGRGHTKLSLGRGAVEASRQGEAQPVAAAGDS